MLTLLIATNHITGALLLLLYQVIAAFRTSLACGLGPTGEVTLGVIGTSIEKASLPAAPLDHFSTAQGTVNPNLL